MRIVAALCLLCAAPRLHGQTDVFRWLNIKQWTAFTELDVEAEEDSSTSGNYHYTSDRLYLAPTLGLDLTGSIYHPNLLSFDIKGQGGYIEDAFTTRETGQPTTTIHDTSYLQNYDISAVLLQAQPYATTFTADKVHTFQELDIFNQVTVDSQSYGANFGYTAGPVPVTLTLQRSEVDETGAIYNSDYQQQNLSFSAQNTRAAGSSTLTFTAGQYDQQVSGGFSDKDFYENGTLTDTERFGEGNRGQLSSSGFFTSEDSTAGNNLNVVAQESLNLRVNQNWESFYNYNFNDASYSGADTTTHYGVAGVRNQLYESLASEFDVHGSLQNSSGAGSSSDDLYGVANTENYTKRLSDWGVLTLGNADRYDLQHENNSGQITPVLNESHTLSDGTITYLNQPLVVAVTRVTDPTGTHVYIRGIDYAVTQLGALTIVQRIPTSLNLPNNSPVLIDYTVQAQPSGSISTFSDQVTLRLDLWHGMLGLYSSLGWVENHSEEPFILENSFTTQSGIDMRWRWLRIGGDYETETGNLIDYHAYALYQSAGFQPTPRETISLDARQRWSYYDEENLSVTDYSFTTRFTECFDSRLDFSIDGGVISETGGLLDRTLFSAGARMRYAIGKMSMSLNYQFNQEETPGAATLRNFFSLTLRRNF